MKVVADAGPLASAANAADRAHRLAARAVEDLGRDLIVPLPVLTEVDYMLRARAGGHVARTFMRSVADGALSVAFLTPRLLRRAVTFDEQYAELNLGLADTSIMALAEHDRLPILTFDFRDFRATKPRRGQWRLVVTEDIYRRALG